MMKIHMFHPTSEACCVAVYRGGSGCRVYDRGCDIVVNLNDEPVTPPPTPPPVNRNCVIPGWHADMSGARDGCTNDENVSYTVAASTALLCSLLSVESWHVWNRAHSTHV